MIRMALSLQQVINMSIDYLMQPGSRSGFDIFLDETLPRKSKYTLTTSYEKSNDIKPEALKLGH